MRLRTGSREPIQLWFRYFASPYKISHKPFKKAELSRKEVLQYRGNNAASKFKLENPERKGESLCAIRPSGCCDGIGLECYGCHPGLLEMGIPCEQQPTNSSENSQSEQRSGSFRDCFCDQSCIIFGDCWHGYDIYHNVNGCRCKHVKSKKWLLANKLF